MRRGKTRRNPRAIRIARAWKIGWSRVRGFPRIIFPGKLINKADSTPKTKMTGRRMTFWMAQRRVSTALSRRRYIRTAQMWAWQARRWRSSNPSPTMRVRAERTSSTKIASTCWPSLQRTYFDTVFYVFIFRQFRVCNFLFNPFMLKPYF